MKKRLITSFLLSIFLTSCVVGSFYHSDFGGASVTDDWPMFQHDAVHSGASSSNAPRTNATLWSRITLSSFGGPAVANGSVYILSGPDYLDCIDAQSGATNWDYQIPGQNGSANAGNPAVVNGNVYFATETGVYCLDASSGTLIWNYTTGVGAMDYSPTVADGKVYVGSWDNKVYCLDANTGALVWNFSTGLCLVLSRRFQRSCLHWIPQRQNLRFKRDFWRLNLELPNRPIRRCPTGCFVRISLRRIGRLQCLLL